MSVLPVGDSRPLTTEKKVPASAPAVKEWKAQNKEPLQELRTAAQKQGMDVQLDTIPKTNIVVIRFVEPSTGRVIREFPQKHLTQELIALQQKQMDRAANAAILDLHV